MSLFLLYFIILTNFYCAETLNIVLSFVTDVNFVMVLLLVFHKMWQFPYPFGFCNPVWIYGRKINDDDDGDECVLHTEITIKGFYCNFNHLPEDEPSGLKQVEDIKKLWIKMFI